MRSRFVKLIVVHLSLFGTLLAFQNCSQQFQVADELSQAIDNSVLGSPQITFADSAEFINSAAVTVQFMVSVPAGDTIQSVSCQLGENLAQDCLSGSVTYNNLVDGNYSLRVLAITQSGGRSEQTRVFRKDSTAPMITVSSTPPLVTNAVTGNFVFMVSDNLSGAMGAECSLDNATFAACVSPASVANLASGSHNFRIRVSDRAGNMSSVYTYSWVVNLMAPTVTISSAPSSFINTTSASLSFSGAGIVSYQCQLNDGVFANCTSPHTLSGLALNAAHVFRVRGTNASGAVSASAEARWTVDVTNPSLAFSQTPQASTTATSANFVFSASDSGSGLATVQCSHNNAAFSNCTSPVNLTNLSIAAHQYRVRATDNAGNQTTITHSWTVIQETPPPPPPVGTLNPAAQLEFINASGVRQQVNVVDGETQVTGIAPFLIKIDASGTRAPAAFAAQSQIPDAEAYAFLMIGYRINFGENRGGFWRYPEGSTYSRDEETGPPLFSRIYHSAGTYNVRLKTRDTLGNEATLRFTINVTAPPAVTAIATSASSWPAFQSNRRYTLQAGGDYRSLGTLETGGLHNIVFEKTGAGADPRISSFSPDGRSKFSATQMLEFRAAHIRLINIDMEHFGEGQRGFDYVGVIGGTVRRYSSGGQSNLWHEGNGITRSNVRYARGLFLQDTELRSTASEYGYIIIGAFNGLHARNTRFVHAENGPTTYRMLRLYGSNSTFRNNLWISQVDGGSGNGLTIGLYGIEGQTPVQWRTDDTVGPVSGTVNNSNKYGYISDKSILQHNQFYAAGSYLTNAIASMGGGNYEDNKLIFPRLIGMEDNVFFPPGNVALLVQSGELLGQYVFWRNNRRDMGQGSYISANTGPPNQSAGDNTTFNGPHLIENQNSRPITTGF